MAECLYYGDKPIGLIQSNAEDVEYSTGVSVKEKIDEVDGKIKTKTVSITTNASGVASLDSLDSEEHILSASVQDRLAIPFWVGSGHANWVKVLNWTNMGVTAETVSVIYTYV